MATVYFRGGAPSVAKVITCTVASTGVIETTDIFRCTIGNKTLSVVAGSTAAGTVATNIKTAWNALSATQYPEFNEITAASTGGASLTLTSDTAGVDFSVTISTVESNGAASDAQTFTQTTTVANAGPNDWSTAANWSGVAVPVDDDDIILDKNSTSIYYGLDQSGITADSLTITNDYTGSVGLPETNALGYPEYRDTYLKISPDVISIGDGAGAGSGRIKINTGTVQTALTVMNSGNSSDSTVHAIIWKGTHASNSLSVLKGYVDVAPFSGEVATVATMNLGYVDNQGSDANVRCGSGVTLGAITKNGGTLDCDTTTAAITSLTQLAGTSEIYGSTNGVTAMSIYGGTVYYNTAGTLTACTVGTNGTLDFRNDMRAKTVTAITVLAPDRIYDPAAVVTWTNGIDFSGCEGITNLGTHRTWTPTAI